MNRQGGFTLIELLVVLAIVATLLMLAMPRYGQGLDRAREKVLIENLRLTREAIDKYYADRRRYPDSLADLVERRYLKAIPVDPVLDSSEGWRLIAPPPDQEGGVADLKSGAQGQTLDGRPYAEL